jgi:hypothetical protein
MRVLHLPLNIASQMDVLVRAQNDLGLHARGLAINPVSMVSSDSLEALRVDRRTNWAYRASGLRNLPHVLRAIHWADVLHWHFGECALPRNFDLKIATWLKKPGVVEFWGSDIRIAEIESEMYPSYARARSLNLYPHADSRAESAARQKLFASAGCECIVSDPVLRPHLQANLFSALHSSNRSIDLAEFQPNYPRADNTRPMIVHNPSNRLVKGTAAVLAAIEALRGRFDFDFRLITNLPQRDALQLVRECDLLIDQVILGTYGLVSIEAMAFGKPAVCQINSLLLDRYMPDCPIVNANPDNLAEVLAGLLTDGQRRHDLGRRGRAYVEKYHDSHQIARQLASIYQALIDRRRAQSS